MPRFFFHLHTEKGLETDEVGLELADLEQGEREARRAIPDIAAEFLRNGRNPMNFSFQIAGVDGVVLREVSFEK